MIYINSTGAAAGFDDLNAQPMVSYRNLLAEGTLADSLLPAAAPRIDATTEDTDEYWLLDASPATLRATLAASAAADVCLIAAHNLAEVGGAIRPQYLGASRTNLLLRSEQFDNAAWTKVNCTITANNATAPNGQLVADRITETSNSAAVIQSVTPAGGLTSKTFTFSVWLWTDAGQPTESRIYIYGATGNEVIQALDVTLTTTPTRYSVSTTFSGSPASTAVVVRIDPFNVPVTNQYLYVWGAQLEEGAATSYIATTTAAVASTWYDAAPWVVPATNDPLLIVFPNRSATGWGVEVTGLAQIGVAWIGPRLVIPGGITPDYTPIWASKRIEKFPGQTRRGHFKGQRIERAGATVAANFMPVSHDFALNDMRDFRQHYSEGKAFVWASAPAIFDEDLAYCWAEGDATLSPSILGGGELCTFSLRAEAYAEP